MKWLMTPRPGIDHTASAWLIRRFIDPGAEFVFSLLAAIPPDSDRAEVRALTADGAGGGNGEICVFESLIARYRLESDRALARLARIVHAAAIDDDIDSDFAGLGLSLIAIGGLEAERDDCRLIERSAFVYDALYAWCLHDTR